MPSSKPRRRSGRGEVIPPSNKLERIGELLKVQLETFPQKDLTPEEVTRWEQDLSGYTPEAIEYAFDSHRRLAMFFPVPGQIIELCETYRPEPINQTCSSECLSRHGKGYGWVEIMKLWELFGTTREALERPLTEAEFDCLLNAVDKECGRVPEWRQ